MPQATAITIGNFDGVHLGHQVLISAARNAVGAAGKVICLAFDPHPLTILRPQHAPPRLTDFQQRQHWLHQAGADDIIPLNPTREFLSQSPQQFIEEVVKHHSPSAIVEGPDFRFGRARAGSIQTLQDLAVKYGYRLSVIQPVEAALSDQSLVQVSSSMVRWLVERGRVRDARLLLGRPFELWANVAPGDRRGRAIGMPTINLDHRDCLLPADGIYRGAAICPDCGSFPAAISVGTKPTFGAHPRVCEAHLIGYDGPLDDYGWFVRLQFHDWLRDQIAFDDVDQLVHQLQRDVARIAQLESTGLHTVTTKNDSHAVRS